MVEEGGWWGAGSETRVRKLARKLAAIIQATDGRVREKEG